MNTSLRSIQPSISRCLKHFNNGLFRCNFNRIVCIFTILSIASPVFPKTIHLSPVIPIRPLPIRNIEYSPDGKLIAVPNLITAGSVGVFSVSEESKIASLPSRVSEKDFYRIAGVFYFSTPKKDAPALVYLNLPELLTGYSVAFSPKGDELAIAGGDKVYMYSTKDWKKSRTITISQNTTRCIFSSNGVYLAVLADGKIYILETANYAVRATIEPASNHLFADMAFSRDGSIIATLEYRNVVLDHVPRVRLFSCINGDIERELPYFEEKLGDTPGSHYPLISFTPQDTAIVVTFDRQFGGKTVLVKGNDGSRIRVFKGIHHNFSPDMSMLAVGGTLYDVTTWNIIGKYKSGSLICAFSPTDHTIATVSTESLQRFKIEVEK
jgi:WD40 repeat protein